MADWYFGLFTQLQVLSWDDLGISIFLIVWINNCFHIWHAAIAYFTIFLLNISWNLLWGGKCLSNEDGKCFPTFVTTFALYGFWCWWNLILFSVGIAYRVYTLLWLVPLCMGWLSSWIFLRLLITVTILILFI